MMIPVISPDVGLGYADNWFELGRGPDTVTGRINDGRSATARYLPGYTVGKSPIMDGTFVFAVIFSFVAVSSVGPRNPG
jgi:hypothetical protein